MREMMFNTTSNNEEIVSFYEIVKKYILKEKESDVVVPFIHEKVTELKGQKIPFRHKNMTREEKVVAAKKSYICENFFNMEMYELEKTFNEVNTTNVREYIFDSSSPMKKARHIYLYTIELEKWFSSYESSKEMEVDSWTEVNFVHLYATFLCLMEELKGTIYEKDIDNYIFLFENIFSFK